MEEHKSMLNIAKAPQSCGTHAQRGRYFKVQIRAWTDFDPMDKKLPEITEAIERGGGLLMEIESQGAVEYVAASGCIGEEGRCNKRLEWCKLWWSSDEHVWWEGG